MATFGTIGVIVVGSGWIENRCRENGNTGGALAAQSFGRFFLIGSGAWIVWQWAGAMGRLVS